MSSKIKQDLAPNIICPYCSSVPLFGINFDYENKNIAEVCELYSYCIFNHDNKKKNKSQKIKFDDIFKKTAKKSKKNINKIKCEFCKKKNIEYHCIKCKINICKDCFVNHKEHKYYYNKEYLSEKELNEIKSNLEESEKNVKNNLEIINAQIKYYESQLEELKELYEKYKDINDKLFKFSDYILKQYTELSQEKEDIYYPLYFNVKNILLFNPNKIIMPEKYTSINSFTNILNDTLVSGFYFLITNSNFSENLCDYNKPEENQINYDLINLHNFSKKEIKYEKMLCFADNKITGIKNAKDKNNSKVDIYNIKYQNIETSLNLKPPEKIFYKKKYNLLIFLSQKTLYILNRKNYSIMQELSANHVIKKEKKSQRNSSYIWYSEIDEEEEENEYSCPGTFTHVEILSKDSFAIIFNGDIRRLGEEYGNFFNTDGISVINSDNKCYENNKYRDYYHLIIYEKEKEIYVPKKIIFLLRNQIYTWEVDSVTGKYVEVEEQDYPYCKFIFDSMTKIKENEYIFAFNCKITADRNQEYFYIIDKIYKNETIFYRLNIKNHNTIEEKICSTDKRSFLLQSDIVDKFYYLCDESESEENNNKLLDSFKDENKKLIIMKIRNLSTLDNLIIHKNTVIGINKESIYYCKIFGDKLEMIDHINTEKNMAIKYLSLEEKTFYYKIEEEKNIEDLEGHFDVDDDEDEY